MDLNRTKLYRVSTEAEKLASLKESMISSMSSAVVKITDSASTF